MAPQKFTAHCPACKVDLVVDAEAAQVTLKPKGALGVDLNAAVQSIKEGAGRRDTLFKKSLDEQKNKGDLLKQKFNEALKKAKESPDTGLPPRDIDLD